MERKKEKHEKKIDKALHLAEERLELLDTIKEMVETEVDADQIGRASCRERV